MLQNPLIVLGLPVKLHCRMLAAAAIIFLCSQACTFNANTQGYGEAKLQGEWRQQDTSLQKNLVTYSLYNFNFDCDSFFVKMDTYSTVNYGADTCMGKGHWAEYAKGSYALHNDTLSLKGLFCNANKTLKTNKTCFRFGIYQQDFKIKLKTDSVYELLTDASPLPFQIKLTRRTTCSPKPL